MQDSIQSPHGKHAHTIPCLPSHMTREAPVSFPRVDAYLKDAIINGQNGHIKGTATQIEHQDVLLLALLIKAVGQGCSRGLIDDALNMEASDDTYASYLC